MLRMTWRSVVGLLAIRNFSFSKNATLPLWMLKSYPLVESQRAFSRNKGEGKRKIVKLDSGELEKYLDEYAIVSEMENEVEKLREQYVQQLSLKNNIRAFEALSVEFDGNEPVPLNHIAQVTLKNPHLAIINLSSTPQAVKAVMKAIAESGMDVGVQQQNAFLYVPLPRPSKAKREQLAKNAKVLYNRCHDQLREIMRCHEVKLRKKEHSLQKEIYNSLIFHLEDLVRIYAQKAEKLMKAKQEELMQEIK